MGGQAGGAQAPTGQQGGNPYYNMLMAQEEEDPLNMLSQKAGQAAGQIGATAQQQQMGETGMYQPPGVTAWTPTQYDPNLLTDIPKVTDPISTEAPPGVITPDEESPNPLVPDPPGRERPGIDLEVPGTDPNPDPYPLVTKPRQVPGSNPLETKDRNPTVPRDPRMPKPGQQVPDTGQLGMAIANNNNSMLRK